MVRDHFWRLGVWLAIAISALPGAGALAQNEPFMGLVPATAEELRGVPLAATPFAGEELPASVDLSADLPPPGNQGKQGSCVGWTVAYALKSYQEKIEEKEGYVDRAGRLRAERVFSPAFIYNQINNGRDGGSSFINALRLMSGTGAATWADMPYKDTDYKSQPNNTCMSAARKYRIDYWRQINVADPKEIKAQINAGYPVMIGAKVDEGFLAARAGYVYKRASGQVKGNHAMLLVGYDDRKGAFKLINSWGVDWCDRGYGWIDYEWFPKVCNEAYVAKDAVNGPRRDPRPDPTPDPRPNPRPDPRPDPTPRPVADRVTFQLTNVMHNAEFPNRPDLGKFLRFDGTLTIPPGAGLRNQTVIYFYFDAGQGRLGTPVRSRNAAYADINGFAACGTMKYDISAQGTNARWSAWIDYNAFILPPGDWVRDFFTGRMTYQRRTSYLVAQPRLFIDNFGVATGQAVQFYVVGF
jgi:hypothetical protein